ncbi:polyprenol monophosphomannose synthase [Aeoliella sp. ICT_H6.2]|uniref:Polyprenol monophosphomannose synthase n=1 Tax=Aeoliella straminimaris TaxID=2954799 RepID=A0A9X2JHV7_9BACT|nr:polyprenol monophosphomannose synthase [Aeoliella straminimaris]MCO6045867.1 polyprenol monophosphomannose synthase [Aeoliella straminimaris]
MADNMDDPEVASQTQHGSLLVSLCTYNERENLRPLIESIHEHAADAHVLVVDDGSPDGTGQLADEMAAADLRVHVMHRAKKMGLGTAILAAMNYAIDQDYEYLLNMDADFSHHPRYIPALRASMDQADVAIGSRYIPGGKVVDWGAKRRVMSWCINTYARTLLRLTPHDTSGSFRCYRVAKLKELDLSLVKARGYAVLQELLYRCRRIGCRFAEVPITFEDRRFGESKINYHEVFAALGGIFRLGVAGGPVRKEAAETVSTG